MLRPAKREEIEAFVEQAPKGYRNGGTAHFFNMQVIEADIEEQRLKVSFDATKDMTNPSGAIQGGMLTAMLDDVMAVLTIIFTAGKAYPATTDLHTQYFKAGLPGTIYGEARIKRLGASMCFTEADLLNEKGQIIAHAVQTARLVEGGRKK